jgi:hypothetical protein
VRRSRAVPWSSGVTARVASRASARWTVPAPWAPWRWACRRLSRSSARLRELLVDKPQCLQPLLLELGKNGPNESEMPLWGQLPQVRMLPGVFEADGLLHGSAEDIGRPQGLRLERPRPSPRARTHPRPSARAPRPPRRGHPQGPSGQQQAPYAYVPREPGRTPDPVRPSHPHHRAFATHVSRAAQSCGRVPRTDTDFYWSLAHSCAGCCPDGKNALPGTGGSTRWVDE